MRKIGGSVCEGEVQGARLMATIFTEVRGGHVHRKWVWKGSPRHTRAKVLPHVGTSRPAFFCQLSRPGFIFIPPAGHWSQPSFPPNHHHHVSGISSRGCVFVCVCAANSKVSCKALTMGILDSLSPIHFYRAPDVC